MKESQRIAVRTLVETVLRAGDLDLRVAALGRPQEGMRVHRRIQGQRPEGYRAEVAVSTLVETAELVLTVGGRIDGVLRTGATTIVEEIKTTARELETIARTPDPCHWGQVKTYACLLARAEALETVTVRLTYCHLDSGETLERSETLTRDELERFFDDLVQRYLHWASMLSGWRRLRNGAIADLAFPFEAYRPGQRYLAVTVYRTLRDGGQLLVQAATGIGKSLAVIYPAVKALGEGSIERVFFLTARNTGQASAEKALTLLQHRGLRLKWVCLTAKERICFSAEAACHPDACPFAKGHYDRLKGALETAFTHDRLDRDRIETLARQHRVCPFDFSLELARWADCIVCDYNYAFDPRVYLRRFFEEENGAYAFLVDEAHNLVDRAREMFSAELRSADLQTLRQAVKSHLPGLYRAAGRIVAWMNRNRRRILESGGFEATARPPEALEALLRRLLRLSERALIHQRAEPFGELLLERHLAIGGFMRVWEGYDDSYVTCLQAVGKELILKLFCLDPSGQLRPALQRSRGAVLFSATLTPADYFQRILGCDPDAGRLILAPPFPADHLAVFGAEGISTYFDDRERSVDAIVALIGAFVAAKRGNYLCFFPSFAYLQRVAERFGAMAGDVRVAVQTPEMDDAARAAFLDRFSAGNPFTLVGFAVMGGVFGEGIDLVGERLSGAVIVGVGLPAICPERELIRDHFARRGAGFDFAYRFPGINRVLQAAGRVIRTDRDRGALLLVDRRFGRGDYRRLLPRHWQVVRVASAQQLAAGLERFWSSGGSGATGAAEG